MNEATESNQSNPEHQNINFAELRAKLAQIKEAGTDPHFADIDIGLLTDDDLEIYYQWLNKTLKEKDLNDWRIRVGEETKSLPRSYDPIRLPDRATFAAYIVNKFTNEKALEQLKNFAK